MIRTIMLRCKWPSVFAITLSSLAALAGLGMLNSIIINLMELMSSHQVNRVGFIIFAIAGIGALLFGLGSRYVTAKLSADVVCELRVQLTQRLMCTPYSIVETLGQQRILSVINSDVAKFADGLLRIPDFIYSVVTVALCAGYLIALSWPLSFVVFAFFIICALGVQLFSRAGIRQLHILRGHEQDLFDGMTTLVKGMKEFSINVNRRRFVYKNRVTCHCKDIKEHRVKVSFIFPMLNNISDKLVLFLTGSIIFCAGNYWLNTSFNIIIGFILTTLYMVKYIDNLVGSINRLGDVYSYFKNIENLGLSHAANFETRIQNNTKLVDMKQWNEIKINQLYFKYNRIDLDEYCFSVGPITTQFKRGDVVFITGGNGCGKTTFAKLVLGLYRPTKGSISVDGLPIYHQDECELYQQLCSAVLADFHLFNQVLGADDEPANDADIMPYLQRLEMDKKVSTHYGCFLSTSLSQSQKKRLALIMSCLEDRSICVFDEWTTEQDPKFKETFYAEIIPQLKRKNKLVIVITQDDEYFELADQLIRLESGQLVKDIHLEQSEINLKKYFVK
ncbi:cyclic peptide export ABC transporter [Vibrio eleionomae]|nr:cyclic peptide export ABC transporter [Vibrio eleionomae]